MKQKLKDALFIWWCCCALFFALSLYTYQPADPGWLHTTTNAQVLNAGGLLGAYLAEAFLFLFGWGAICLPVFMLLLGYQQWKTPEAFVHRLSYWGGGTLLWTVSLFCAGIFHGFEKLAGGGGILGRYSLRYLSSGLGEVGVSLFMGALFGTSVFLWFGREGMARVCLWFVHRFAAWRRSLKRVSPLPAVMPPMLKSKPACPPPSGALKKLAVRVSPVREPRIKTLKKSDSTLPDLALLQIKESQVASYSKSEMESLAALVEEKLQDFGVDAKVSAVYPGPVVTRLELHLAPGVKVGKLSALSKDLARALAVVRVRIVEIIPGKPVVGLELPNQQRATVYLHSVLASKAYHGQPHALPLALGQDISGGAVVVDLAKMPHLLVAGTTGSGKSVGLNAMLVSLLYHGTPSQVRLILIDPKMLELSVYDGIPHLLTPVVTDMKQASNALRWCVAEMERRYQRMAALGVRHIESFNEKIRAAEALGEALIDPCIRDTTPVPLTPAPYIVVVIDEFADMMMIVGKKVEDLIARLAQKARAAGIHMILATQRPSVDVITGLIKANIPTRIAFQVSSKIDSRTILDQQGAEQLLGHGDMLYLAPGTGVPLRVHGAYVGDQDIHRVTDAWREKGTPEYLQQITETEEEIPAHEATSVEHSDPLYDEVVSFVLETRKVSASRIQRRFRIGFNRAASLVEAMEAAGLVSEMDHNGSRVLLVGEHE